MSNILIKLKSLLNGLSNKELSEMELWINNSDNVEIIVIDDNSISLITEKEKLKIDDKEW